MGLNYLIFFLRTLQKQKNSLQKKIDNLKLISKLHELFEKIIKVIKDQGRANMTELNQLTGANKNTLILRLREPVNDKILTKHGAGKSTYYTLNSIVS